MTKAQLYAGRGLAGLLVFFLAFDALGKIALIQPVLDASSALDIPVGVIRGLGVLLLVCTLLYAVPMTSFLGAILLTGYLGGAVWTHVRMGGPVFPVVFSSTMGVLVWASLFLREPRLRALLPLRKTI